jgi:small subunit ribosomal protein S20
MPITKSAKKAMNRSKVLEKRNYGFKLRMKMAMKKFLKSAEAKENLTIQDLAGVYKAIDKAQKAGIIKKRNAARKKSRIAKAFDASKVK